VPHAVTVGNVQLTIKKLSSLLGSPPRWLMLVALGQHEWLPGSYLARVAGLSRTGVSQHLRVLRENYIVERGMGRLYRLRAPWRTRLADGIIDFHLAAVRVRWPEAPAPAAPGG